MKDRKAVFVICIIMASAAPGCLSYPQVSEKSARNVYDKNQTGEISQSVRDSIFNYAKSRANDFLDIFIIGIEHKTVGLSIWLGPIGGGLQYANSGEGFGLRSGHAGYYQTGSREFIEIYTNTRAGNSFIFINSKMHRPVGKVSKRSRNKAFKVVNAGLLKILLDNTDMRAVGQIELSVGLFYGLRIGVDVFEFFDFMLGWFGVDISSDDYPLPKGKI